MGVFASSGSNLPALLDGGASVVAVRVPEPENDERNLKAGALAHGLPGVHNYGDVHDSDIERHAWNPRSVSAIVAACNANDACKSGYQWPPGPARSDDPRHTRPGTRSARQHPPERRRRHRAGTRQGSKNTPANKLKSSRSMMGA